MGIDINVGKFSPVSETEIFNAQLIKSAKIKAVDGTQFVQLKVVSTETLGYMPYVAAIVLPDGKTSYFTDINLANSTFSNINLLDQYLEN